VPFFREKSPREKDVFIELLAFEAKEVKDLIESDVPLSDGKVQIQIEASFIVDDGLPCEIRRCSYFVHFTVFF